MKMVIAIEDERLIHLISVYKYIPVIHSKNYVCHFYPTKTATYIWKYGFINLCEYNELQH